MHSWQKYSIYDRPQYSSVYDSLGRLRGTWSANSLQSGEKGRSILLTDAGKRNAIKFGENLSAFKVNKIITTPVERCIQTAECIVDGYGQKVVIEPSNVFGGLHVKDWKIANDFLIAFYHYSLDKTIYTWENWVNYLSGLILNNGQYVVGFQNNKQM